MTIDGAATSYLDPRDLEYAETLPDDERELVVRTVTRFRRPDRLQLGDELPQLELLQLADGERVRLMSLVQGRPVVLVFGSFT
jgi:hypothetical protein